MKWTYPSLRRVVVTNHSYSILLVLWIMAQQLLLSSKEPTLPVSTHVVNDTPQPNQSSSLQHPNQFAIVMIHYHKTGFVLSRQLRSHAVEHLNHHLHANFTLPPPEKSWGSIRQPRKFESNHCPMEFGLEPGRIHVQESPDLYCNGTELAKVFLSPESEVAGTKLIHFVRNPYSMALSNYYYHAQIPTPEPWVNHHHPCKLHYWNDTNTNNTLRELLFPTLSDASILTQDMFDQVVELCTSLYQTQPDFQEKSFGQHLQHLDPIQGLKLATTQMMIRGGGVVRMPGGDLLRMSNNILRLKQLQQRTEDPSLDPPFMVHSISMDEFLQDPLTVTETYLNLLLMGRTHSTPINEGRRRRMIPSIAHRFVRRYHHFQRNENEKHITNGKHEDRHELIDSLKKDAVLGPILDSIETLYYEALESNV